jgi:hypothetical protein
MKKIIKRVIGSILVIGAIALSVYGFSRQFGGDFWVGGIFSMSAFLLGLGGVLLFDGKIQDIF